MSTNPGPTFRNCDIVMKGGITSGVVYPPAVVALSKKYSFRNIGGTSAGAIAAAVTAAAEFGRQHNREGFSRLANLPADLGAPVSKGGDSLLLSLFQPQKETNALFRIVVASLGNKRFKAVKVLLAAIRHFIVRALIGALPGLVFTFLCIYYATGVFFGVSLVVGVLLIILGVLISVAIGIYGKVTGAIPQNHYGLCRGFIEGPNNVPVLTPWLSRLINETAGIDPDGKPLTFGDLYGLDENNQERRINLQMMTTNLTTGRPHRLPFSQRTFYFDPAEWSKFFPANVIDWLLSKSQDAEAMEFAPLRQLPAADDFPVIVATRMSLSFPILLSAVPIYARDFGRTQEEDRRPQKCWFSDGGICSNFPVHFFDSALPRWPTFAINLRPFHPDHPDKPVFMPDKNVGGTTEWFTNFDQGNGRDRLFGFFGAILNTLENWRDNMQTRLPGYRDRIAHVSLNDKTEGGLNLNMPSELIIELGERGEQAAELLMEHFTVPADEIELSWDNHRWVRYRSMMGLLEEMLQEMEFAIKHPAPGDRSYEDLISRELGQAPKSYAWRIKSQRTFGSKATVELMDLIAKWESLKANDPNSTFTTGTPKPQPELKARPQV
jgi:predicted acylesterase/phospholipase RssA